MEDTLLTGKEANEVVDSRPLSIFDYSGVNRSVISCGNALIKAQDLKTKRKMVEWLEEKLIRETENRGLPNTPRYEWILLNKDLQALKKQIEEG